MESPSSTAPIERRSRLRHLVLQLLLVALTILAVKAVWFVHLGAQLDAEASGDRALAVVKTLISYYDSQHYEQIASGGYNFADRSNTNHAFFPLFPAVLRVLRAAFPDGTHYDISVALFNLLASTIAGVVLWSVLKRSYSTAVAWWTVVFLFNAPTAVFLDMKYTESLFLLFSSLVLLCVGSRCSLVAIGAGFLAGITRPQGVALSVLTLSDFRARKVRAALSAAAPLAGFIAYAGYVAFRTDNPLEIFTVQRSWGRHFAADTLFSSGSLFDAGYLAVCLTALAFGWRWLRRADFWFFACLVAIPVSTGSLLSFSRFAAVMYPLYIVLAVACSGPNGRYLWPPVLCLLVSGRIVVQNMVSIGAFVG